jgi:hypothetical protein
MRRAAIATLVLTLSVASAPVQLDARQASPSPQIHRVTLSPADGVLVIEGAGLGADLVATVDGQSVTTLPGATEHRMDVQAPTSVLTTPGTYRLTLVDPVRKTWDGFIVASAPVAMAGVATTGVASAASPASVRPQAAAGAPPAVSTPSSYGPRPLTVIEDSGSPFRTALGAEALASNTTGQWNTGIGNHALESVTTGNNNTAVGGLALHVATGSGNTAVGTWAMPLTTAGSNNVSVGYDSLLDNTTGTSNTAVGRAALSSNTTANLNTAVGSLALSTNLAGANNVAVGANALSTVTGHRNTGIGAFAGEGATSGDDNIFIGGLVFGVAGDANTIRLGKPTGGVGGQNRAFIAGIRGTTVSGGEGVYIDAAGQLGSGPVVPANDTVGSAQVIADSLTAADLAPNSVGTSEVVADSLTAADLAASAVGTLELADNAVTAAKAAFNYAGSTSEGGAASDLACAACVAATEVSFAFAGLGANTFAGTQTIGSGNLDLAPSSSTAGNLTKGGVPFLHDTGTQNTFLGQASANFTLSGEDNTGLGSQALRNLTDGSNNTGVGSTTLWRTTSGADNTASGFRALFDTTTGGRNTAVGSRAGHDNTTGSDNIYLGANVRGTATDANTMRLGLPYNGTTGTGQNKTFIAGIAGTVLTTPAVQVFVDANGQLGTLVPAPITGAIDGTVTPGAVERRLAEQDAAIAQLRAELAALRAIVAAPARRR